MKRIQLLLLLAVMPEEAFGWVVASIARGGIWPDGLSGFKPESRVAINEIRAAADAYPGE